MKTPLQIYVDRLRDDHEEKIQEEVASSLLKIDEPNLHFAPTIKIDGKAYLADDHLILQLNIKTEVTIPCSICNEEVTLPLVIKQFIHTLPLSSIPSHVFDYSNEVREVTLLNTPEFTECHSGQCPQRGGFKKFIKTEKDLETHVQYPFSDLDN